MEDIKIDKIQIPGIDQPFEISKDQMKQIAEKFLSAVKEASNIYNHIADKKGKGNFIPEISMDEVEEAQSPVEMFFIPGALAFFKIPAQTIAPKFTGRFNKGVDYIGDLALFKTEFEQDILVIDFAVKDWFKNTLCNAHPQSHHYIRLPEKVRKPYIINN